MTLISRARDVALTIGILGVIAKTRATVVQAANTEIYRRRYRRLGLTRQEISDYENAATQAAACGVTPEQIHEMSAAVARGKRFIIDPINTPPEGTP